MKKLIKALFGIFGYEINGLPGADIGVEIRRKKAPGQTSNRPQAGATENRTLRYISAVLKFTIKKLFRLFDYMIYALPDGDSGILIRKIRSFEKVKKRIQQPKKITIREPVRAVIRRSEETRRRDQQYRLLRVEQFYAQDRASGVGQ